MNDDSTISWMIMGGPRYDGHSQAELDQRRALQEQHLQATLGSTRGWRPHLGEFLRRTMRPTTAQDFDCCSAA